MLVWFWNWKMFLILVVLIGKICFGWMISWLRKSVCCVMLFVFMCKISCNFVLLLFIVMRWLILKFFVKWGRWVCWVLLFLRNMVVLVFFMLFMVLLFVRLSVWIVVIVVWCWCNFFWWCIWFLFMDLKNSGRNICWNLFWGNGLVVLVWLSWMWVWIWWVWRLWWRR